MEQKPKRRLIQLKLAPAQESNEDIGASADDSVALKHQNRLNWFRLIGCYILCCFGLSLLALFSFRYLHLINGYEKVIDVYIRNHDWQIYLIYGLSLAFTAGMVVSVFYALLTLIRKIH